LAYLNMSCPLRDISGELPANGAKPTQIMTPSFSWGFGGWREGAIVDVINPLRRDIQAA
jgi:hypothetical protein